MATLKPQHHVFEKTKEQLSNPGIPGICIASFFTYKEAAEYRHNHSNRKNLYVGDAD